MQMTTQQPHQSVCCIPDGSCDKFDHSVAEDIVQDASEAVARLVRS